MKKISLLAIAVFLFFFASAYFAEAEDWFTDEQIDAADAVDTSDPGSYYSPPENVVNDYYEQFNIEPFGGEGFGEDPNAGIVNNTSPSPASGGPGAFGGDYVEWAPGNDKVQLEDNTYGFLATDGNYYWIDENGDANPVDMSGVSGTGGETNQAGNYFYNNSGFVVEANQQQIDERGLNFTGNVTPNGERVYTGNDGKEYYVSLQDGQLRERESGYQAYSESDFKKTYESGTEFQYGQSTTVQTGSVVGTTQTGAPVLQDAKTGQLYSFQGSQRVPVNTSTTQVIPIGASSGMLMGGTSGSGLLGGVGSWVGNLLGLSGGVGYNKAMGGVYGGLGFNSSSGYGASSGGGLLSSLIGGGGTTSSGGFSYVPGQGWTGGMGFSSGTGTSGYSGVGGYGGYGGSMLGGMGGGGMGWNPANYVGTGLPAGSIYNIIQGIVFWILAIFGFICIIGFVIAGIMYLLAAGDEKSQEKAKKAMYYSITGVIVGLAGLVIIFAVNALLRGASYF